MRGKTAKLLRKSVFGAISGSQEREGREWVVATLNRHRPDHGTLICLDPRQLYKALKKMLRSSREDKPSLLKEVKNAIQENAKRCYRALPAGAKTLGGRPIDIGQMGGIVRSNAYYRSHAGPAMPVAYPAFNRGETGNSGPGTGSAETGMQNGVRGMGVDTR